MTSRGTVLALRYSAGVLHVLAVVMTGFRATYRWRRRKFSWDDGWAIVAAGFNCVLLAYLAVRASEADRAKGGHPVSSRQSNITYLWGSLAYACTVWAARISIACSILRVTPNGSLRTTLLFTVCMFFLTWGALLVAKIATCTLLRESPNPNSCSMRRHYILAKLVTDLVADSLLIAIPLFILWRSRLPKILKRIIRIVFATTIVTAIMSIVHIASQFENNTVLDGATALYEGAITVMVCNLLVIITYLYRISRSRSDMDEYISTTTFNSQFANREPTGLSLTEVTTTSAPSHVHPFSSTLSTFFSRASRLTQNGSSSPLNLNIPMRPLRTDSSLGSDMPPSAKKVDPS